MLITGTASWRPSGLAASRARKKRAAVSAWSIRPKRDSVVVRMLPVTESPTTSEPTITAAATATPNTTKTPVFQ